MLVNDRGEIDTGECHLSFPLCGHRLISPKVVVDSACVAQTFSYPFERMSDSLRTFERKDTHYLAPQRGILYISIRFCGKLLWTGAVRLRLGLAETGILNRTQFKKGTWLPLGINAGVSATGN